MFYIFSTRNDNILRTLTGAVDIDVGQIEVTKHNVQ
jgi:hypothetical protein